MSKQGMELICQLSMMILTSTDSKSPPAKVKRKQLHLLTLTPKNCFLDTTTRILDMGESAVVRGVLGCGQEEAVAEIQ